MAIAMFFGVVNAQQIDEFEVGSEFDNIFDMEVSVASKNTVSLNETPGVVSVITYDEIQNSGARNLIDVLNLVPGFDFGMDVTNSIGAGMRYDKHSMVEGAFSPRLSFTKDLGKFHYKALYSRAFRTRSVANLVAFNVNDDGSLEDISPDIKPEKSDVFELELGYQFTPQFSLSGNVFHTSINDPMVYYYHYDEGADVEYEGYCKSTKYGSNGVELEGRFNGKWGYLKANYSYYSVDGINKEDYYAVSGNSKAVLASTTQV